MRILRGICFLILLNFLLFIGIASAFGAGGDEGGGAEISVIDRYGREVALDGPAERIVSLAPGITETVFALGYGDRLVGRTSYCDYPPETGGIPVAGTLSEPDIEVVLAMDPDLVVASTHFTEESLRLLESVGLTVAVLKGERSFDGIYDGVIRPLSHLLGDPEAGERLVAAMESTVEDARAKAARRQRSPTVYYVVGFGEGGDWTAGGGTFIGRMIALAGGENIAEDVDGWSYSLEALVAGNPDVILVPERFVDRFVVTPIYADLRAVREGHVYGVDEDAFSREGPRIAEAFVSLVDVLGEVP